MVAAVLLCLVHLGARVVMLDQHRTELGGVERNVITGIQKLMLDIPLYQDPELPPFDVMQYGPGYYLLCAQVAQWAGVDPLVPHGVFVTSRIVSLLLNLLTVLLLGYAARLVGADRWMAILATLLLFCSFTEPAYSRIDALHLFFFAAATTSYLRWCRDGRTGWLALAALLTALSFFSKQSGLLVGGLIALHLAMERRYRHSLIFISVLSALLIAGHTWIYATWPRDIYLKNTVQGLMNGINLIALKDLLLFPVHLFSLGWYALAAWVALRPVGTREQRFLRLAAPLALAIGLVAALKAGSSLNYLYEGHTLTAVACAALLSGTTITYRRWTTFFLAYALFFMTAKTVLAVRWVHVYGPDELHRTNLAADLMVRDVLFVDMGLMPGEYVFIDYRDHLEHLIPGHVAMAQKDIVYLSRGELFDRRAFHRAMQDGTVRFAIFDKPTQEVTFLGRSYPGFVPVREVAGRYILEFSGRR
jgi:hypothetical protein